MEEVLEPVTAKQVEATENQKQNQTKQIQALRDSAHTTTQAIQDKTRAIRESSNALNKNLQKSIKEYDENTNRKNQLVTDIVNSNQVDSSIVKTVSNLPNDKNKKLFSLEPVEGNSNSFLINPADPHQVTIKGSTMTFQNRNTYNLNDPDLHNSITKTQMDKEIQNKNLIHSCLNDMEYNLNYGDHKLSRYEIVKSLFQPQS